MAQQQIVLIKGNKKYLHPFKLIALLFSVFVPVLTFIFSFFDTHYFYDAIFFGFMASMFLGIGRILLFYPKEPVNEPINFSEDTFDSSRKREQEVYEARKFYDPSHPLYPMFHRDKY